MASREQKQPNRKKLKRPSRVWRAIVWILGLTVAAVVSGVVLAGCNAAASAPDVTKVEWNSSTIIYDREGQEIYRLHAGENRTPVKLDEIPKSVIDAFIAVEDPNFRDHYGVDPRGFLRAVFKSTLYYLHLPGGRLEGGSTITQQFARQAWLTQEISIKRKIQEAWVAIQLERKYTKDEILEMYLNQIYFGQGAYGIEAASRTFFAKEVGELNLPESAQLAGMANGPGVFDPYEDMDASLHRRNIVLAAMLKENLVSQADYDAAKAFKPTLGSKNVADDAVASHFVDYVITILQDGKPGLADKYGLKLGDMGSVGKAGLKVYTTLDSGLQKLASDAVTQQMNQADKDYGIRSDAPKPEAAMVTMNPKTGEVLAMVGGREHRVMLEFNRATDALRQPGSSIKPLVAYTPALSQGLSPATIIDDAPVMLTQDGSTVWPQNYDFKYLGLKPMRYGVEQSINPMAVRAMIAAGGPSVAADYARNYGLTTVGKEDENLALALGGITKGTTVLDMAAAYSAIDNMGTKVDPIVITKIVDRDGDTVFQAQRQQRQVIKPSVAYLMIDMMKDVIRRGTAYGFTQGFKGWPAAGKTGTTEYNRDGWFIGFTPDLVTAVWNGYDKDGNRLPYTGAFVPVKIWNQFMTRAVTKAPADWVRPADVVSVQICRLTGSLPNELCPKEQVASELFIKGTEPTTAGEILVKAKAIQVSTPSADKKSVLTEWQFWKPGCAGVPVERLFIKRPQPRVLHPTDPLNPKYVPGDAKDAVPTKTCQASPWWDRLLPDLPSFPGLPGDGGQQPPGESQPPSSRQPAPSPGRGNVRRPVQPPGGGGGSAEPAPPPAFSG